MDVSELVCEICGLTVQICTCPDIDERTYNFDLMAEALRKQNPNRMEERKARLLSVYHFVMPEQLKQAAENPLEPWKGYRDKIFEEKPGVNARIEGAPNVDQGPEPSPDTTGNV